MRQEDEMKVEQLITEALENVQGAQLLVKEGGETRDALVNDAKEKLNEAIALL